MSEVLGLDGVQSRITQIRALIDPPSVTTASSASASTLDFATLLSQVSSTSSGQADVSAQDLIASAEKYLGTPYVWGGESLSEGGLDCSGLVVRSLADLGVTDVPRTAAKQQSLGSAVPSLSDAVPGDLLFFDNGRHVAIYLGGDRMIEAPAPGGAVRETEVWAAPTSIRRVLPQEQATTTLSGSAAAQRLMLDLLQGVSS
jgi:peptidoglycan DL-endopeptidase CwlO